MSSTRRPACERLYAGAEPATPAPMIMISGDDVAWDFDRLAGINIQVRWPAPIGC
jgi:hypothetical protein